MSMIICEWCWRCGLAWDMIIIYMELGAIGCDIYDVSVFVEYAVEHKNDVQKEVLFKGVYYCYGTEILSESEKAGDNMVVDFDEPTKR